MKKTTLLMIVSIVMAMTLSLGGTLAYLTAEDGDVNVMVVGNVDIRQDEWERETDNNDNYLTTITEFTQNQVVLPAVLPETTTKGKVDVNGYDVPIRNNVPNYVDKMVTVTNTGRNSAYVRTIIAIPSVGEADDVTADKAWLHWNYISDTDTTTPNGWYWSPDGSYEWPQGTQKFYEVLNVPIEVDGEVITYDIFVATNINVLDPGESTAPSLTGVYMDPRVDHDAQGYFIKYAANDIVRLPDIEKNGLKVLVMSQAVQADGFGDAWTALEAGHGKITKDNHPWIDQVVTSLPADTDWYTKDPTASTFTVSTAAELTGLATLVNNGTESFSGKTVVLGADVSLFGYPWTPIGTNSTAAFRGTFDGQGNTITGMSVSRDNEVGLFGHVVGNVKNVNIEDATVTGKHYVGAVVGYIYGNVTGCSVENATITCVDPAAVDGDKAAAVIGWLASGTVENNSAKNVNVTANRDAGQIIGCLVKDGVAPVVQNNTADNVSVQWSTYGTKANINNDIIGRDNTK